MSTQIGNTTKSFGREYNVSVSNMGGENILASEYLKENTIIIDSKVDNNLEDVGSYSIFVTDVNGKAVRLTYTIQPGNGLYVDPNDTDVIRMRIDENSIMADDGDEIYVNKHNIIDNNTLAVNPDDSTAKRGRIAVVTANLQKGTNVLYGIVKGDENTTYINEENPGVISVNTQNLETVHDGDDENEAWGSPQRDGIVRHNSQEFRTIKADNGKLEVLTYNLDRAQAESFGIAKGDEETIRTNNGTLSVMTDGLDHANSTRYGIVKGDGQTVTADDGILTVNTRNLLPATSNDYGVVMFDDWSIGVSDNNKLEVKRFPEIEALLKTNNPEHEIFRRDIEDLKNRVTKLETTALQEIIEFFTPVGDPTTDLPKPVFDRETWSVINKYADRKTIAFQIKTNCKFYVNVDYKQGTNDYGQVTLLNVQLGNGSVIPYDSLTNNIFDSNDKKVQTLWFTFQVKNYDADNNQASTNTQVIITAASINDASINQTAFHIFKCWNNKAYEEEQPTYPETNVDVTIPTTAYWIVEKGTEKLAYYSNTSKAIINELAYGKTSSKNFYFNTYVSAVYYDGDPNTEDPHKDLPQSSSTGNDSGDYKVIIGCYDDAALTNRSSWATASISASYSSTKQFNVLTVKSNTALNSTERTTYINVKLEDNSVTSVNRLTDTEIGLLSTFKQTASGGEKITENIQKLTQFNNLVKSGGTVDTILHSSTNLLNVQNKVVINARENIKPTITAGSYSPTTISSIIEKDIIEYSNAYDELSQYNNLSKADLSNKTTYVAYYTAKGKVDALVDRIAKEWEMFGNTTKTIKTNITTNNANRSLIFKYTERMNEITPTVNVTTNIAYSGAAGINVTITRNANSYLNDNNWGVNIKYNFINKNGDVVDANGNVSNKEYGIPTLYPGTKTTYTYTHTHSDISAAASGYRTETETSTTYCNVIAISGSVKDRGSLWGIGNGHKDEGNAYWGSYTPSGGTLSSIPDDIYLEFKLTGQDAKYDKNQNYSYWSFSIKGKTNGYSQALEQANDIEFMGISSSGYSKRKTSAATTAIKKGNNYYILKSLGAPSKLCNQEAAAEKTTLNSIARTYYVNHSSALVASTTTVPVQVANNITGIRIKSVEVTNNAFNVAPSITYSSTGSWKTNSGSNSSNPSNNNYTFGNAKITSIYIEPWDDLSMTIKLNIAPGTATNIPNGTEIVENTTSNNGTTKFTFLQDSKSYLYTQFYSHYTFNASDWNGGCTVTIKLYNQYSLNYTALISSKETVYMRDTNRLQTVYLDGPIKYAATNNTRNATYQAQALLTSITGIKFWVGLNTKGIVVQKKFESSTSSMGVQVNLSGKYSNPVMKSVVIENALYTNTTTTSNYSTTTVRGGGGGSQVQYTAYYGSLR